MTVTLVECPRCHTRYSVEMHAGDSFHGHVECHHCQFEWDIPKDHLPFMEPVESPSATESRVTSARSRVYTPIALFIVISFLALYALHYETFERVLPPFLAETLPASSYRMALSDVTIEHACEGCDTRIRVRGTVKNLHKRAQSVPDLVVQAMDKSHHVEAMHKVHMPTNILPPRQSMNFDVEIPIPSAEAIVSVELGNAWERFLHRMFHPS